LEFNTFIAVIAIEGAAREYGHGLETPYVAIDFLAYDPVDWKMGDDREVVYLIDGRHACEKSRENMMQILHNIHITAPSTTRPTASAQAPSMWISMLDDYFFSAHFVNMTVKGYNGEVHFRFETDPEYGELNEIIEGFVLSLDGPHMTVDGQATVKVPVVIADRLERGPGEYNRILPLDVILKPIVVLEGQGYEYIRANPLRIVLLPRWGFTSSWANPREEERIATISEKYHKYSVKRQDAKEWISIDPILNEECRIIHLAAGDTIRTEVAPLKVEFKGGKYLRIGQNTAINLREPNIVELIKGEIRAIIKSSPSNVYTSDWIKTPEAIAGVRGTDYIIGTEQGQTITLVLDGEVSVSDFGGKKTVLVKAGEMTIAGAEMGPTEPEWFQRTVLNERYISLFESQEEIDTIIKTLPESLLLIALLSIEIVAATATKWRCCERPDRVRGEDCSPRTSRGKCLLSWCWSRKWFTKRRRAQRIVADLSGKKHG